MPESSIVIFADGHNQNRYRDMGIDKESLNIFPCANTEPIVARLKANVVLIDCGVHSKKGLQLLKKIKTLHPQIPVIFVTDASSEEVAIAAFRTGAREYFASPVNRLVLKKTIQRLIEIRHRFAEMRKHLGPLPDTEPKAASDFDNKKLPPRLEEILLYISENPAHKITLSLLAGSVRMSKYHFSRYFRKYVGVSPIKYVNSIRIKIAQELLKRNDLTVTEIAHQVGYEDLNTLLRHFKKETGLTPTELRKGRGRNHCGPM